MGPGWAEDTDVRTVPVLPHMVAGPCVGDMGEERGCLGCSSTGDRADGRSLQGSQVDRSLPSGPDWVEWGEGFAKCGGYGEGCPGVRRVLKRKVSSHSYLGVGAPENESQISRAQGLAQRSPCVMVT